MSPADEDRSPAGRLLELAQRGHTGVVVTPGRSSGEVHLRAGMIVHAQGTGHAPGDGPRSLPPALRRREVVVDAVREVLEATPVTSSRWKTVRNRMPAESNGFRLSVAAALTETERRAAILERIRPLMTADTRVTLRLELPSPQVRIAPPEWELIGLIGDDGLTPRGLAVGLRDSVFRTVCRAHALVLLGLLETPSTRSGDAVPLACRGFLPAIGTASKRPTA